MGRVNKRQRERQSCGPQHRLRLVIENAVLFSSLGVPSKLPYHPVPARDLPQLPPGLCCGTCRSQLIRWLDETIALRTGGATVAEGGTHCCARGRAALRGGRARAAAEPERSPAPAGGRRRRTELRVPVPPPLRSPARPIGRVRPGPPAPSPPPPPQWCRPAPADRPGIPAGSRAPLARRRPAPRPHHGRRRQRA